MLNAILSKQISIGKYKIFLVTALWFLLALVTVGLEVMRGIDHYHNFFTYKFFYQHCSQLVNPYYGPIDEFDCHYGPIFSLVIYPFTIFPNAVGCILWSLFNAWFLFFAVNKLPINPKGKQLILLISLVELATATGSVQINPMIAAWMILAYVYVEEEKDWLATLFIVLGFFVKLYGIVGLTFFLFSKHKVKFMGWFVLWTVVFYCLPMIITNPSFTIQLHIDWIKNVAEKNSGNITGGGGAMQDISLGGLVRRVMGIKNFSDVYLIIPFAVLYFLPLLRKQNYSNSLVKQMYAALGLITVVVLSSSSESPTYIIAVVGCAYWYVLHQPNKLLNTLIVLVVVFTSLSATELFPAFIRKKYFIEHSLKALPCVLVWLSILAQLNYKKLNQFLS